MARKGKIRVGTSGWAYKAWRGRFYPRGLGQARELTYLAQQLGSVEINGTFYSLTTPVACDRWRASVPARFVFVVKGSRYLTHMLKLRNFAAPLANFLASGILRLGAQLDCVLWQLPPQLAFQRERVLPFFDSLPRDLAQAERRARQHDTRIKGRVALTPPDGRSHSLRHAVEVRHPSWLQDEALRLLESQRLALVAADSAGRFPFSLQRTADFAYARLHGAETLYSGQYSDEDLETWSRTIRRWAARGDDVYAYFDNDADAHAPTDAARLQALVTKTAPDRRRARAR